MKYIYLFVLSIVMMSLTSCYEGFISDYEEPSMGFAVAKPLRTVIADSDMSIYVGVAIGGKRQVDMTDWASFVIDESLLADSTKMLLPATHYTLSDNSKMTVRKDNLPVADVQISFTDAFYADAISLTGDYILPLRMTDNSLGRIRTGGETTLVAIKYISRYAGTYYRLGSETEVDASGNNVGTPISYGNTVDLIKCSNAAMQTMSPKTVVYPGLGLAPASVGSISLEISGNSVIVSGLEGFAPVTNGSGQYIEKGSYDFVAESGAPAPQFNLDYVYQKEEKYYHVTETLVLRQPPLKDLRVETW